MIFESMDYSNWSISFPGDYATTQSLVFTENLSLALDSGLLVEIGLRRYNFFSYPKANPFMIA